jgi:pilus assembly protein CpaE
VAGFEVGADDYLTKPTNPTELQTHVRNLLAHAKEGGEAVVTAPVRGAPRAHMIGVLAARGGLGVSTVAVNLAASLCVRGEKKVILAELTPGQGTLGMELGLPGQGALSEMLRAEPDSIRPDRVKAALMPHPSGLLLLLASENPRDVSLQGQGRQYDALVGCLGSLASYAVMDLGAGLPEWAQRALPLCRDRIVVTEASSNTIAHTRMLLDEMAALGIDPRTITVVLNNRIRFESQLPYKEAQEGLGHPIDATLTPAPDLMVAAARRRVPAVIALPENVTSQQVLGIADKILAHGRRE